MVTTRPSAARAYAIPGVGVFAIGARGMAALSRPADTAVLGRLRPELRRHGRHRRHLTFSAISGVTAAVTLLLICLVIGTPLSGYPARSWWALIGLALVTQVVGHLSVACALGRLPVSVTSIALLGQAPITAVLAVPLLGERIGPLQLAGGALVLAGIYVVNHAPHPVTERTAPYIE